jgi:hypothetical protein
MRAVSERVRAYFAPVERETNTPTTFDPAAEFGVDAPPAPWISAGTVAHFKRAALTEVEAVTTGAKGTMRAQARRKFGAEVSFEFLECGKLQMALSCGSQQMNVIAIGASPVALETGSTASELIVGAAVDAFAAGDLVAVDVDYEGETGYIGSGVAAAYVKSAAAIGGDMNYIRRVTFNVARVKAKTATSLELEQPLIGGVPESGAKAQKIVGFVDREGSSFFQEWSALFVFESESGGRLSLYYPRVQAATTAAESHDEFADPFSAWGLKAKFRALPVVEVSDGEEVVCYRAWMPSGSAALY